MVDEFKRYRRAVKSKLPYVRRRVYRKAEKRVHKLESELLAVSSANSAECIVVKELTPDVEYLCYFVTFSPKDALKPHVQHHINQLIKNGVAVLLIVNYAGESLSDFKVSSDLMLQLSGVIIRQNIGFDFAAWSHAFTLFKPSTRLRRAFFVNDSIVGPIGTGFSALIEGMKQSRTPVIALTDNPLPKPHVQSFFWSLSADALFHPQVTRYLEGIVNFSDKQFVIDVYEVGLTERLETLGFGWESVFNNTSTTQDSNQTIYEWSALLDRGFPFVKASLFGEMGVVDKVSKVVPETINPKNY